MKIDKLGLKNFRIHKNTEIMFDHVNVIVGNNGSGKTSIKDAIEYCFNGKNRLTDGRGSGANVMINWNADKALIELYLYDMGCIKREIPNDLQVCDWSGKKTVQENALFDKLDTSKTAINAILNTTNFINLDADQQKELIFNLSGLSFSKEEIIKEFLKWNQGEIDVSRDILSEIITDDIQAGSEVFKNIYKKLYELRRKEKRKFKDIKSKLKSIPEKSSKLDEISESDKEEIMKQYRELSEKRDKIFKYLGKLESNLDRKESLENKITDIKEDINNYNESLNSYSLDPEHIKKLHDQKQSFIDKLHNIEDDMSKLKSKYNQLKIINREKKEAISFLEDHDSNCPLAPDYIDCPLTEEEIDKLICNIKDELEVKKENNIKNNLSKLETQESDINNKIDNLSEQINNKKEKLQEKESIENALSDSKKLLDEKNIELDKIANTKDIAEFENKIANLDKRLNKGKKLIKDLQEAAESKELLSKHKKSFNKSKERVEALKLLVEAFKPSGIKSDLLTDVINKIQSNANVILKELSNDKFKVKFKTDSEQFLLVKKKSWPHFNSTDILSTSEKLRIGVIIQHVLNQLTGLKFLLIDKADTLDFKNRQLLINTVLNFRDKYDQIIILSTIGNKKPENPDIEGLKIWCLENGNLKEI